MSESQYPLDPAPTPPAPTGARAEQNLSRRIEAAVERLPSDIVRCVRVYGEFYRCNWWSRDGLARTGLDYDWAGLLTDHIRKSGFFRAILSADDALTLEEINRPSQYATSALRE